MSTRGGALGSSSAEEKRARLAALLRAKAEPARTAPASFAQARLWVLARLDPESTAWHLPFALRVDGALDLDVLARAFSDLARRHEAFRTTFREADGGCVQVIAPPAPVALPVIDAAEADLPDVLRDALYRPFDLARGPLFRVVLVRLAPRAHVLALCMHHIVSDGWSFSVIVRELTALYEAHAAGRAAALPALPIQYADFAGWQRGWLAGDNLAAELAWWRRQLDGAPQALALPAGASRGSGRAVRRFSGSLLEGVAALCRREDVTPFMALQAAFQALLARYSGQRDFLVGVPTAGRTRAELEGLVGYFLNTVALRARLDGEPTVRSLLARVRETTLDAFAHQLVPFEHLPSGERPRLQVLFLLQNFERPRFDIAGLTIERMELPPPGAMVDLSLTLRQDPDGLYARLDYDPARFDAATASRLLDHFGVLAEALAVADPSTPVERLPLMGTEERRRVEAWSVGPRVDAPEACLHGLVAARAAAHPEAVAVDAGDARLTYAALVDRARRFAGRLAREAPPGSIVGVCLERSCDLVVALLGILEAGCAWLPLDPALPRDRLAFFLEDAGARLVVTDRAWRARLPDVPVVMADDLDAEPLSARVDPRDLAYVLYTSGSTGQPKGVAIEHRSVCNLVAREVEVYGIAPGDRVLQFANLAFDISVEEIFTTLAAGATVCVAPLDRLAPGEPLRDLVRAFGVTVLSLTPAVLAATESHDLPTLRTVISGGEACPADLVARWGAGRRFFNTYGPTEATVVVTVEACAPGDEAPAIGRPLGGMEAWVLDEHLAPVPAGVAGELHLGGVALARGYLGRPALTAERFVPHPSVPGARLYRTGDRARWRDDGRLEFLGRVDRQVKLRGLRIELEEIEAAIAQQPGVREAAVALRDDGPAGPRLVAWVAPRADDAALRRALKARLPAYMVPSAFVVLDRLPLTPNGKVDRAALPAPVAAPRASTPPRTPTEARVAALWAEVLGLDAVGADDDFFELGGHSLLATQVTSRLRAALGVEVPLRALFEATTVAALARAVDARRAAPVAEIAHADHGGAPQPLSSAQQRLWFLAEMEPDSPRYNIPIAVRVRGPLDEAALGRALDALARRHEAFRTTFGARDGVPFQTVLADARLPLASVDLTDTPAAGREARAEALARSEAARPFDLARAPLARVALGRFAPDDHVLVATMHHIVSDGWSMAVLVRELGALYAACRDEVAPSLAPPAITYLDYARWQRAQPPDGEGLAYWTRTLASPPSLELPADRPRPAVASGRGEVVHFTLPNALADRLAALGRAQGASLFMTLLAGWQALVARYTGATDVVVGTPIAGRARRELEGLIGFFVNTLALRTDLGGDPTFEALVRRVKDVALGAYAHQDVPFERIVEAVAPARDAGRTPIVQVAFGLQNVPFDATAIGGLEWTPIEVASGAAKFDVTLLLTPTQDGLRGALEYDADLFDRDRMARMAAHFGVLLAGAAARPSSPLSALPVLAPDEIRALEAANETAAAYPRDASIASVFARVAARRGDAVAVEFADATLTYAQLAAASRRLAGRLRRLGVGLESRVGLCVEPSAAMVVAMLGILEAGGAYVPLDPAYPRERLAMMAADSGLAAVVAQAATLAALPAVDCPVVRVEDDADDAPAPRCPADGGNLAYVIYTSGSTGVPKGVGVEQRSVLRLVLNTDYLRLGDGDRVAQLSNTAFDAATFEVWGALLCGGTLVGIPRDVAIDPARLVDALAERRPSVVFLTTALFNEVARHDPSAFDGVGTVLTGGEKETPARMRDVLGARRPGRLLHVYGPTEVTTYATWHEVVEVGERVPIGRPIANTTAWVLDAAMRPAPAGVPGELYLGGDGVARGYLGRPELTAEKFVPDPFSRTPGARLYRTGDLVRLRADGAIEFLGRADGQVKLRGFRIEPGEIEAALATHPGVSQSVVLLREDAPGDRRLVAYVAGTAAADALRAHLRSRLPEHMVPSAFVTLDALPRTPNGKIDRRALPAPDAAAEVAGEPPRTATEERLAAIWRDVLRIERPIGRDQGFFDLGGHSLLATQVVARVRSDFAVDLPLRALFEAPTLAGLAARVDALARTDEGAIAPAPRTGALPLSFAQQRLWFLDALDPGRPTYNVPVALRLEGALDDAALERALAEIVHRHEALRTSFAVSEGVPSQGVHADATLTLERVDAADMAAAEAIVRERAARPFDLGCAPLVRATLVRLAPADHVLALTMHHIVSDGWSLGVLVREVAALYAGRALAPLPVQYADYAVWQRDRLRDEALDRQLAWWTERLAGLEPLDLPTDRPRPAVRSDRGATLAVSLPAALSTALADLARREGATPFMALCAATQALLARWSGQDDVAIGTPVAGRTRRELEGLIGFFVNTLVVRTDLSGRPSFRALLARVKEAALGAFAHQDVPFEKLVEAAQPARDPARSPLFQVMLALQNAPAERLDVAGLSLRPIALDAGTSRFDLTLSLAETADGLRGHVEFSTDLFDRGTIERWFAQLRALIEGAVARPDAPVADLPLLAAEDRARLLAAWSDATPGAGGRLDDLFAAQAARTPDAEALRHAGEGLTYRALRARAYRLAHHLRRLGVGPESTVGLLVERSFDMVAGVLGVLAAGGAYVPLDPTHPAERLAVVLADVGARVVLTHRDLAAPEGPWRALRVEDAEGPDTRPPPLPGMDAEAAAYVIFTSGSTGRPKGVVVPHAGVGRLVEDVGRDFAFGVGARSLQFSRLGFDASVWEMFLPLCGGGTVVLADADALMPGEGLTRFVRDERVDALLLVPSVLALVPPEGLCGVRLVVSGGEALSAELAARWRAPGRRVVNAYGPTDVSIVTTLHDCDGDDRAPPLGRPVAGRRVYVLDPNGDLAPVGVPGELFVGGVGLARGYVGDPALTAARFVPDPFSPAPGARMYRTGDRCRITADGRLEFLGRVDRQVKIRGLRIELGEIEAALTSHPGVAQAVAVARDGRLVAYVAGAPDVDDLRAHLRRRLPDYMAPSAIVPLDALPLTPNGKVDLRALPAPSLAARAVSAPRTPAEAAIVEAMRHVLGAKAGEIGVDDDFFALGGHSLLATQLVSRLRDALGAELPLRALFEAPTPAGLAGRVEAARGAAVPPIRPAPRGDEAPLSFAQQRLWLLDALDPGRPTYHVPEVLRLEGALDVEALRRAFEGVLARHESLRTVFVERDGEPVQRVLAPWRWEMPVVDVAGGAREAVEREVRHPFDLRTGPTWRTTLLRLGEREHVLVLVMHHVVSDGWSLGVLVREAAALYAGAALPPLAAQYPDYALWQRAWLAGEALDRQVAYWRERLDGVATLDLPTDRPRPAAPSGRGAIARVALPAGLSARLNDVARREGVTLFMLLLGAFQVVLARLSGQPDVAVGTPIAGRTRAELEGLIGFFVNTLVLRTDVAGARTFRDVLARVKDAALGAYAHQDLPFEKLVEALHPARRLDRTPIFQVMFALQNAPAERLALPGLRVASLGADPGTSRCDLTLSLAETPDGLRGVAEYATDLFDEATIRRWIGHFHTLLEGIAARPDAPLRDLPLLTPAERAALAAWNATASEYPRAEGIARVFARVAARRAGAIAVEFADETLTYAELWARARRLAARLRRHGAGLESRVGLCVEPSAGMVVAMLGILEAGAAYVPLDPAYPRERLAMMAADSGLAAVLAQAATLDAVPPVACPVLRVEDDDGGEPPPADCPADGGNLAYVVYTSGSTGVPKGVGVEQRSVLRLVLGADYVRLGDGDRVAQLSNTSFDAATFEVWGALLCGGTLVGIPRDVAIDPARLSAAIAARRPTALFLTTALFNEVARQDPSAFGGVGTVLVGGEEASPARMRDVLGARRPGRLLNAYGPTEVTTFATWHEVVEAGDRVPIGRPIANTTAWVLDADMEPSPPGAVGELYLGGDGVARGYLGRPDLTAARFVPDPFSGVPGARLYRTGDFVRTRADGAIEFIGRADGQVKVRGFRIELGEIEAALAAHPAVAQAVAVVRDEGRLVAYVVPRGEMPDLRAHLRASLPDYMLPSAFVTLDALPLTPNGKLDRRALPAPARSVPTAAAPRTATEETVGRLMAEVLGLDDVGADGDFFALGGHSLLAVRLMARLREAFGVALPLRALFEGATVATLAARLERDGGAAWSPLVPIRAEGEGTPLFLVHPGGGGVLCYRALAARLRRPVYGLESAGLDGARPPLADVEAMAARYVEAIRTVAPRGPYRLGGWSMGGAVAFAMAQLLEKAGESVEVLALIDSVLPAGAAPDDAALLAGFAHDVAGLAGVAVDVGGLAAVEPGARVPWLLERLRAAGVPLPAEAAPLVDVFRANVAALWRYVPAGGYAGRLALVRASESPDATAAWAAVTERPPEVVVVPGDHYGIVAEPGVAALAEALERRG